MLKNKRQKPIILVAAGNKRKLVVFLLIFILIALLIRFLKPLTQFTANLFRRKGAVNPAGKPLLDKVSEAAGGAALMGAGLMLISMAAPLAATPIGWAIIAIGAVFAIVGFIAVSNAFNYEITKVEKPKQGAFVKPAK